MRLGTRRPPAFVFTSALTGLPPFYVMRVAAGMLGFRQALSFEGDAAGREVAAALTSATTTSPGAT